MRIKISDDNLYPEQKEVFVRYRVTYTVGVMGNTADGDCYYGESFRGTVVEYTDFECDGDENSVLAGAKIIVVENYGEFVSVAPIDAETGPAVRCLSSEEIKEALERSAKFAEAVRKMCERAEPSVVDDTILD